MDDSKAMAKIEMRVEDKEGNVDVETPWATPLGNNLFRLENSPFYAYGVSYEDVIEAVESKNGGFPTFTKVVEKSGNRTVRIVFDPPVKENNESKGYLDKLVQMGCSYEGANPRYLVINIPKEVDLSSIRNFLIEGNLQWEHADPTYAELFPEN